MRRRHTVTVLALVLLLEPGCAGPPAPARRETPARLSLPGFSLLPPRGGGWGLTRSPLPWPRTAGARQHIGFRKPQPDPSHVVALSAAAGHVPVRAGSQGESLLTLTGKDEAAAAAGRYRLLLSESARDRGAGRDCIRYHLAVEDRGVPGSPGAPFVLRRHGLRCAHPDAPSYVISAEYAQRMPAGVPPADLAAEGERFLGSLVITPLAARVTTIPVGREPIGIAVAPSGVWVATRPDAVVRLDPRSGGIVATVRTGRDPRGVAWSPGAIWVANRAGDSVSRIDPATNRVVATIPVGRRPLLLGFGAGALWVGNSGSDTVSRVDPATNRVAATIRVGREPTGIAAAGGAVWVANFGSDTLSRIDPATNRVVATIRAGHGALSVRAGADALWVVSHRDDAVWRLDPRTGEPTGVVPAGGGPAGLAVLGDAVWVASSADGTVTRIDARTARAAGNPVPVGEMPLAVEAGAGALWVTNAGDGTVMRLAPRGGR